MTVRDFETITPVVIIAIYRDNPDTIDKGDIVAMMNNLIGYEYKYLKLVVDDDYWCDYHTEWNREENNHAWMKWVMLAVGCVMLVVGVCTGNAALALFGLDMVTSNLLGFSIIDAFCTTTLRGVFTALGRNTTFMDQPGFSFFQFTSDHVTNLIFTQVTFMAIGGLANGLKGILKSGLRNLLSGNGVRGALSAVWQGIKGWASKWWNTFKTCRSYAKSLAGNSVKGRALSPKASQLLDELVDVIKVDRYVAFRIVESGAYKNLMWKMAFDFILHQTIHLATGTVMLAALQFASTCAGEGSVIVEIAMQALIVAQILASLKVKQGYDQRAIAEEKYIPENNYFNNFLSSVETMFSGDGFKILGHLTGVSSIVHLITEPVQFSKLLAGLQIAMIAVKYGAIAGQFISH
jgi:hypothetical protein